MLKCAVDLGLELFLATNLFHVEAELMKIMLATMADSAHTIMESYDSIDAEEMHAIKGCRAHENVTANLLTRLDMKKALGVETKICASLVLQKWNCGSIAATIDFLLRLALHRILIQPIHLYGEVDNTNFHLVKAPYGDEARGELCAAIDTVFSLAADNTRIRLSEPDIWRWRQHFVDPTRQTGACASTCFVFVNSCGDFSRLLKLK